MQGFLLVLAAVAGGGEFDTNTAYPELANKVAQVKPAPLNQYEALDKQRKRLDKVMRDAVRPASAQPIGRPSYSNPVRTVGFEDELNEKSIQPAQFEQKLFPRRGVDGSVYGQGREASKDPTAGSGHRLQPVPPKSNESLYGTPNRTQKPSPFLPDPTDKYGVDSLYGDNDESSSVDLSGYEPTATEAGPSPVARKSPAYRPPTRGVAGPAETKKETPNSDLSLMFPGSKDAEFDGYGDPKPAPRGPAMRMSPPQASVRSGTPAPSIYGSTTPVKNTPEPYGYGTGQPDLNAISPMGDPAASAATPRLPLQRPTQQVAPMVTTQSPQKPALAPMAGQQQPTQYSTRSGAVPHYAESSQYSTQNPQPMQPSTGQPPRMQQPAIQPPAIPSPRQVADSTRRAMQAGRENLNKMFENPIPTVTPVPGSNRYAMENDVQRAEARLRTGGTYFMTLLALFASVGLNFYLGWIAFDTYNRYQDLVADMKYNGARRERGERRLAESSY